MAEREVKIRVTAEDATGGAFGRVQSGFAKMRGELESEVSKRARSDPFAFRPTPREVAPPTGFLDSIKSVGGGKGPLKDIGELLVGGGAIAGVTFLAKTIGEAAKSAEDLRESWAKGRVSTEQMAGDLVRSLPVLGQMTTMWDSIGKFARGVAGLPSVGDKKEEADKKLDERRADAVVREKAVNEQLKKQKDFRESLSAINQNTIADNSIRGLKGSDRAIAQAENELNRKYIEANKLQQKAVDDKVGAPLIEDAKKTAAAMKAAARNDYNQAVKEATKDFMRQEERDEDEHNKRMLDAAGKSNQIRLQMQGQSLAAEIEGYKSAYEQQRLDLREAMKEKQKDLDPKDIRFQEAQKRFEQQSGAAEEQMNLQIVSAKLKDSRDKADANRKFRMGIADVEARAASARLKSAGMEIAAEKVTAQRAYLDQLDQIKQDLDVKLREHADRAPELRQQAKEAAAAAGLDYQATLAGIGQANIQRTRGIASNQQAGLLTGVSEQSQARRTDDPLRKAAEETVKQAKRAADSLDKLVAAATAGGIQSIIP